MHSEHSTVQGRRLSAQNTTPRSGEQFFISGLGEVRQSRDRFDITPDLHSWSEQSPGHFCSLATTGKPPRAALWLLRLRVFALKPAAENLFLQQLPHRRNLSWQGLTPGPDQRSLDLTKEHLAPFLLPQLVPTGDTTMTLSAPTTPRWCFQSVGNWQEEEMPAHK